MGSAFVKLATEVLIATPRFAQTSATTTVFANPMLDACAMTAGLGPIVPLPSAHWIARIMVCATMELVDATQTGLGLIVRE